MSSTMPGPWEQPRVTFEQGVPVQAHHHRLQIGDLHGQDAAECSPVEDQSEGYRSDGNQQRKKEIKRTWREEWKSKHRWVYPIKNQDGELRLKCQWCSLFNMDNVFAREGCSTIQMSALNTHAKSEAHKTAEGRLSSSEVSLSAFPDNLFDGCKNGSEACSRDAGSVQVDADPSILGTKRKAAAQANREPSLVSIMQKHNNRIAQLLAEAETGRNTRHASSMALAKKQLKVEEQRLQVDQQLLEQDKARLAAQINLGQGLIAALTNIGESLNKIGDTMEARKASLL